MSIYPEVIGEFPTLAKLLTGKSIARFGDGELKLVDGDGIRREPANEQLSDELRRVLHHPHDDCIVGIPTMDPLGKKYEYFDEYGRLSGWIRHKERFAKILSADVQYYSAFITRPDSAPWIDCAEFAFEFEKLWKGKRVTVLCEQEIFWEDGKRKEKVNSILKVARLSAKKVSHVVCPHREAYEHIDRLEREIVGKKNEVALLSCGPTATCLANRLAARGIQGIDIGSAGGYLLKLLNRRFQ